VTLVINVTDVNDKIYTAAAADGRGSEALAREMTAHYVADTDRLGLGRPDHEPLASETIGPIVDLIADLVERGHAYAVDGDVYFAVRSFPGYGALSGRDVDQMDQGEGIEGSDRKRDPLDFALWKAEKPGEDTAWDSPWGRGRPGWHIECSAMAEELLGVDFDIHMGGTDLVFPHHENEAAQTLAARGRPLARIWMHHGMLGLGAADKMSKSEGDIRLLGAALDEVGRTRCSCTTPAATTASPSPTTASDWTRRPRASRGSAKRRAGSSPGARLKTSSRSTPRSSTPLRTISTRLARWVRHSSGFARPTGAAPASEARICATCSACWGSATCST
jgi:cysteinyl-tRNA synthetase